MPNKHFMQAKSDEQLTKKSKEQNTPEATPTIDQGPTSIAVQRALANPNSATLTPSVLNTLQRSQGNQFVTQLTQQHSKSKLSAPIQMKMSVTAADDQHEHEADSVAANVISKINSGEVQREREAALQAKRIDRAEEEELMMKRIDRAEEEELMMKRIDRAEEEELMMKPIQRASSRDGFDVSDDIEQRIESSRGGGSTLDDTTRENMEGAFGADFSNVRVHTDSEAANLTSAVQARAFTTGSDIYFNEGESPNNQELLAHELTHTIQQGAVVQTQRKEQDNN
jgi:hypothetical protein